MKKIVIGILLCASVSLACFCASDIMQGFSDLKNYIVNDMLKPQRENIDKLTSSIQKNNQELQSQNQEIKKLIELEKSKALQYSQMVFLLTQKRKTLE